MLILIVEDDKSICEVLSLYMRETQRKAVVAQCVRDALIELERKNPKLVLLDFILEKEDATEIIRRIKEMEEHRRPQIVLMSAYSKIQEVASFHKVERVLKKPFNLDDLENHLVVH